MGQKTAYTLMGIAVLIGTIWTVKQQREGVSALRADINRVQKERDNALAKLGELTKAMTRRENSLDSDARTKALPRADEPFENVLEVWLGKIHRVMAYVDRHPEKRILQMDLLTPNDWLDVTKDKTFNSEADFREALGRLRGLARQKTAKDVGQALLAAVAASGGQVPSDPQALAPYLPAGVHPEILQQLAINPSGEIEGLKDMGGKPLQYVLVDKRVDDLWDATLFYATNGGWGSRSASAVGQSDVAKAIAQFTQANGAPPASASQLLSYPKIAGMDPSRLEQLFTALTAKPEF